MKKQQKSTEFWAQSDQAGGITDELVQSKVYETPFQWR